MPEKHFSLRRKLHRSYFLSCYFWTNWPEVALLETLRMSEQPSSKDDVRRGLGMLPQQADLQKSWTCTGLHCLPICEGEKYGSNLFPTWEQFRYATYVQFVHKSKCSFPIFELVPNLGTSEIKSSHDRTCSQIGNKSKSRNRTSRQFGEKLFLFPTSCREAVW